MTTERLGAIPDTSTSGRRVAREPDVIAADRRHPQCVVSANGTELTCNAVLAWCSKARIHWHYIAPGKPMQNGHAESLTTGCVASY